ncbi:BUB protein kinase [Phytophthora palmivora]|uniref:BUB protein kinase n=1 Tax=Phytophthora palmivora TaxID=4796 RepID=A0A2P4X6A3_9STRA|nr:BUB protein kinase [Phytophthora palmivora]
MTINTRVALEDINSMFCSPPREPKPIVWEVKEDDPVERKLHFSVFDDSVDSVAVNAQDQSLRQDPNESITKQTFQIFSDDNPEEPRTGRKQPFQIFSDDGSEEPRTEKKTWSQKRKPLGVRDDLVRSVRLTNKDVLMQAEKDVAAKDSTESIYFSHWIQDTTKNVAGEGPPRYSYHVLLAF